jgi:hypothetical protein
MARNRCAPSGSDRWLRLVVAGLRLGEDPLAHPAREQLDLPAAHAQRRRHEA